MSDERRQWNLDSNGRAVDVQPQFIELHTGQFVDAKLYPSSAYAALVVDPSDEWVSEAVLRSMPRANAVLLRFSGESQATKP